MASPYDEIISLPGWTTPDAVSPGNSPGTSPVKIVIERDYFAERVIPVDKHAGAILDWEAIKNFDFEALRKNLARGPNLNSWATPEVFGPEVEGRKNFTVLMWLSCHHRRGPENDLGSESDAGELTLLEYFLVNGASTRYLEGETGLGPFHFAVLNQTLVFIQRFLDVTRIHPDMRSGFGETALMLASSRGRRDVIQLLIRRGANVDSCDREGKTSLMCSAENEHLGACLDLIAAGAKIETKDFDGKTASVYYLDKIASSRRKTSPTFLALLSPTNQPSPTHATGTSPEKRSPLVKLFGW
jgi:hypothetical protein